MLPFGVRSRQNVHFTLWRGREPQSKKRKEKRTCSLNALFLRLSLSLENASIKCFKIRLNFVAAVLLLLLECLEISSFVISPFVFFVFCFV